MRITLAFVTPTLPCQHLPDAGLLKFDSQYRELQETKVQKMYLKKMETGSLSRLPGNRKTPGTCLLIFRVLKKFLSLPICGFP
jgi:hypothetical protein